MGGRVFEPENRTDAMRDGVQHKAWGGPRLLREGRMRMAASGDEVEEEEEEEAGVTMGGRGEGKHSKSRLLEWRT